MRKFYRQEARRILAGQKKMSTILITGWGEAVFAFSGKGLTVKRMPEKPDGTGLLGWRRCGKAEDGSG
jgi:hypothetical protein